MKRREFFLGMDWALITGLFVFGLFRPLDSRGDRLADSADLPASGPREESP